MLLGLPGNPVSSLVCAHAVPVPAIRALSGDPHGRRRSDGSCGPRQRICRPTATGRTTCGRASPSGISTSPGRAACSLSGFRSRRAHRDAGFVDAGNPDALRGPDGQAAARSGDRSRTGLPHHPPRPVLLIVPVLYRAISPTPSASSLPPSAPKARPNIASNSAREPGIGAFGDAAGEQCPIGAVDDQGRDEPDRREAEHLRRRQTAAVQEGCDRAPHQGGFRIGDVDQKAASPCTERRPLRAARPETRIAATPGGEQRPGGQEAQIAAAQQLHENQERWIDRQERRETEGRDAHPGEDSRGDAERDEEGGAPPLPQGRTDHRQQVRTGGNLPEHDAGERDKIDLQHRVLSYGTAGRHGKRSEPETKLVR